MLCTYLVVAALGVVHVKATVAQRIVGALTGGQRVEASAHRVTVHDAGEATERRCVGARRRLQVQRRVRTATVLARITLQAAVCGYV